MFWGRARAGSYGEACERGPRDGGPDEIHTTYASPIKEAGKPGLLRAFAQWLSSGCSGVLWLANHWPCGHHPHWSPGMRAHKRCTAIALLQVPRKEVSVDLDDLSGVLKGYMSMASC